MFFDARAAPDAPPPPARDWDPAVTIPTLVGSLLSFVATGSVIICWLFYGGSRRREFRYALILNLTFAGTSISFRAELLLTLHQSSSTP